MAADWFRVELFVGEDGDAMEVALRWRRLARGFARSARACRMRSDREDAEQAARECRAVAVECWRLALQRHNAPPPPAPPRHRMPIGRAELNRAV